MPEVSSELLNMAGVIRWADAVPQVWDIVTRKGRGRSVAWGPRSSHYIGWAQHSKAPDAILERLRHLKKLMEGSGFFAESARFTINFFGSSGFTGGFFQEFDERFSRGCVHLDFTPETKQAVIKGFLDWCGTSYRTQRLEIDGVVVWTKAKGSGQ